MQEFEKKVLLTPEEYTCLRDLGKGEAISNSHINYYYDSDDLQMNNKGITCRIREKEGEYTATIKAHQIQKQECSIENSKIVINEYDDSLFENMHVKLQGELKTERTILYQSNDLEAVLDKNTYLGVTDYELEIEYKSQTDEHAIYLLLLFANILHSSAVIKNVFEFYMRTYFAKSKSERFFKRKKEVAHL